MPITTIRKVDTTQKAIFLTFDDGPHPQYTPAAVEALQKYHSQASWFILGKQAQAQRGLLQAIHQGGNDIGVHSYDHVSLTSLSRLQIISQLERTKSLIMQETDRFWPYFRPPYGAFNRTVLDTAASLGFRWNVLWSVDPRDYASTPGQIIHHVLSHVSPGAIVILHEVTPSTTQALPIILQEITKRGYQAAPLSRFLPV